MKLSSLKKVADNEIYRLWLLCQILSEICTFEPKDSNTSSVIEAFKDFNQWRGNNDFVKDAKLFLSSEELARFSNYVRNEFENVLQKKETTKRHFQERVFNGFSRELNSSDSLLIEQAYYDTFFGGICDFKVEESPNPNFIEEIVHSIDDIFDEFHSKIDNIILAPTKIDLSNKNRPQLFNDIFYDDKLMESCIKLLQELSPPLIDTNKNYIGKSKGAFCVWIDEMKKEGIIKSYSDRKIYANLIPTVIKNFSIDESMFGKPQKRAEEKYQTDIKLMLSQIKLSQSSH